MSALIYNVSKAIAAAHGNDFDKLPDYVGGLKKVYENSAVAALKAIAQFQYENGDRETAQQISDFINE